MELYVGIDLGATNIKAAAVSRDGEVLAKLTRPTQGDQGPEHVIARVAEAARDAVAESGGEWEQVLAVGVGTPGLVDWRSGHVFTLVNLDDWEDIPLAEKLRARFGGTPCFVENDATAACHGEHWLGAGRGARDLVLLTLGTGVGGGIVIDGKLHRGPDGTAGEIGHMIVQRGGRECGCGSRGCLEAYASVTGMVQTAREGLEAGEKSALLQACGGDMAKITGDMISERAQAGDPFANRVIAETGQWLGTGIASLLALLNPEKVILAGGMIQAGPLLLKTVKQSVADTALKVPAARAEILYAQLGEDAGALGAAGCAKDRI